MTLDLPTINYLLGIVVSVLTSIGLVGGFVLWIGRGVTARFVLAEAEIERVEKEAAVKVAAADARAKTIEDELRRTIEAHKLYAAEHFATEEGMSKALEPVLKAIERLADRLDQLLVDGLPSRPAPRTRS